MTSISAATNGAWVVVRPDTGSEEPRGNSRSAWQAAIRDSATPHMEIGFTVGLHLAIGSGICVVIHGGEAAAAADMMIIDIQSSLNFCNDV